MPQLADNYAANPTGAMVTIKCSPWRMHGRTLLLGDAAHAIVPFFGQGINCGFEDCTYLVELLDQHGADWTRVFTEFEKERKVNTDAIADMAIENFTEMRDRVADSRFLLQQENGAGAGGAVSEPLHSEICHGYLSPHSLLRRSGSRGDPGAHTE